MSDMIHKMSALMYGSKQMQTFLVPQPKDNQVLIKVRAVSLNNADLIQMKLSGKRMTERIIGTDVAGTVVKTGQNVKNFAVNEPVFGWTGMSGACAEYAVVNQKHLAKKPDNLSFEEASTLPTACGTALSAIQRTKLSEHPHLLIDGSTGGVGLYALQLARRQKNVKLTVTCSSHNAGYMRKLGVWDVVPYDRKNITKTYRQFDAIIVINGKNRLKDYRKILRPGGRLTVIGGLLRNPIEAMLFGWLMRGNQQHVGAASMIFLKGRWMDYLARLAKTKIVHPQIDQTFSWHHFSTAVNYKKTHHSRGKIVIKID